MSTILVADSGSTKTSWALLQNGLKVKEYHTTGINPYLISLNNIKDLLTKEIPVDDSIAQVNKIYFYSAGVRAEKNRLGLEELVSKHFNCENAHVYSDLLGAARATCGSKQGVLGILGTGSNSCYYNGKEIGAQHPSLGYVVGDEGGGVYLGKRVLQYYFYNTFDAELKADFEHKYGDNLPEVLENIYQKPFPNKYLASFSHFLAEHRGHYMIENILEDAFLDFFTRHILKYRESWQHPVCFVGSVADAFKDVLSDMINQYGLEPGLIVKEPMEGLLYYHQSIAN